MVKKVKSKKTVTELSKEFYQKSLDSANAGKIGEAYLAAKKAVSLRQDNHEARKMLILSALELGKREEAEKYLTKGMYLAPSMLTYIKIQAKLYLADQKPQQALDLLLTMQPDIGKDGDYYTFIAAVRQKLGDHTRAIKLYTKLLKLYPREGGLWAGIAVSFDSLDEKQQSISAYKKAQELGGMDTTLSNYVDVRLIELN